MSEREGAVDRAQEAVSCPRGLGGETRLTGGPEQIVAASLGEQGGETAVRTETGARFGHRIR
jgi:hypothetical protein